MKTVMMMYMTMYIRPTPWPPGVDWISIPMKAERILENVWGGIWILEWVGRVSSVISSSLRSDLHDAHKRSDDCPQNCRDRTVLRPGGIRASKRMGNAPAPQYQGRDKPHRMNG